MTPGKPVRWRAQRVLLAAAAMVALIGVPVPAQDAEQVAAPPRADGDAAPPKYVFLKSPEDLERLLERLTNPDFVLVDWGRYKSLLERASRSDVREDAMERGASVRAITLRGSLEAGTAALEAQIEIVNDRDGRVEVPVRLDGLVLTEVMEGERVLAVESTPSEGWRVGLEGRGVHQVRIKFLAPVRSSADGQRLELVIPEAGSTRLEVDASSPIVDPELDTGERLAADSGASGGVRKVEADISTRSQLSLRWRAPETQKIESEPSLLARGEILLTADTDGISIEAVYDLTSERGEARSIDLYPDAELDDVRVLVDNEPVAPVRVGGDARAILRIALPGVLRPGSPRRLSLRARHPMRGGATPDWRFQGFAFAKVESQTGVVAVTSIGEIGVSGENGRGLVAVNPATELPRTILDRSRPRIAYRFHEQPFELRVSVVPTPPWVKVESRTTIDLSPSSAHVDALLDYRVSQGQVSTIEIWIPEGLALDSLGPDSAIESAELTNSASSGGVAGRGVVVRLSEQAASRGTFELHLSGRTRIDPASAVRVPLFSPLRSTVWNGAVLLAARPEVDATVRNPEVYSPAEPRSLASWNRSSSSGRQDFAPIAWMTHGASPAPLELGVTIRPRDISARRATDIGVDLNGVDVRTDFDVEVVNGVVDEFVIGAPRALATDMVIDGVDVSRREQLEPGPDGHVRTRLRLGRGISGRAQIQVRSRLAWPDGAPPTAARVTSLGVMTLEGASLLSSRARILADESIAVEPVGDGWHKSDVDSNRNASELPAVWVLPEGSSAAPLAFRAHRRTAVSLPAAVIARLLVRTTVASDDQVRVVASCGFDAAPSELRVELPEGAQWVRASLGDATAAEIEQLERPSSYRIRGGSSKEGAASLAILEYLVPRDRRRTGWWAPRFPGDCQVLQSFWEVRLPWDSAVLGVPDFWYDENEWYWDLYVWKRRPRHSERELDAWVRGDAAGVRGSLGSPMDRSTDEHGYLFSRPGEAKGASVWLARRPSMVAVSSGIVLGLGLVALSWTKMLRLALIALAAITLAIGVAWHPSLAFQFLQSSAVGIALLVIAAVLKRFVSPRVAEPSPSAVTPHERPTSTYVRGARQPVAVDVGMEESTIIRRRGDSTADAKRVDSALARETATPAISRPDTETP